MNRAYPLEGQLTYEIIRDFILLFLHDPPIPRTKNFIESDLNPVLDKKWYNSASHNEESHNNDGVPKALFKAKNGKCTADNPHTSVSK